MFEYIGEKRKFNTGTGTKTMVKGMQVTKDDVVLLANPGLFKAVNKNEVKKGGKK